MTPGDDRGDQLGSPGGQRRGPEEVSGPTIVGVRPPGASEPGGAVPRGIEALLRKAAADPGFRAGLLARRGEAAATVGIILLTLAE
jgi:hypothetical protein